MEYQNNSANLKISENIIYIEKKDKLAFVHTIDSGTRVTNKSLKEIDQITAPNIIRVHKSFLINTNYIIDIIPNDSFPYTIVLQNDTSVPYSSRYYKKHGIFPKGYNGL